MTKKIVKAYNSLSPAKQLGFILVCILLVVTGTVVVATAAGSITFSSHTPGDGAVVPTARPVIGVTISAAQGTITVSDLQMTVDNTAVTPSVYSSSPGNYAVSYTPVSSLSEGSHTVAVSVLDEADGLTKTTSWSFAVDSKPKITAMTPAEGATSGGYGISLTVKDTFNELDANTAVLKIDGQTVPAAFRYEGYDWTDSCGVYQGYVVTSLKDGFIEYQPVKDGPHTAEVSIADVIGNVTTKTWSFTVAAKPSITGIDPENNENARTLSAITVNVTDNDTINPGSIVLKVNNSVVNHTFDSATGAISYSSSFTEGSYTAEISVADMAGNVATYPWSFTVGNIPPNIYIVPYKPFKNYTGPSELFQDGMTVIDGKLAFHAIIVDNYDDITSDTKLRLDGVVLPASIRYEGRSVSYQVGEDEEGNPIYESYYNVTSMKKVYVDYVQPVGDGPHTLSLTARDVLGKEVTKQWTFTGATKPVISEWKPAAYITDFVPVISVKVKDNDALNLSRMVMTFNGQRVTPSYDPATGMISYTPAQTLANESYHTVTLSVYDVFGTGSDVSWKFNTNTYPDMPDSSIDNCTSCHTYTENPTLNGPFESIHDGKIRFGGSHNSTGFPDNSDCSRCHNHISVPAGCGQCHGQQFTNNTNKHGGTVNIQYIQTNPDPTMPVRVTQNREMWDCVICHQPGSGIQKRQSPGSTVFVAQNNHDIPELHKAPASTCVECHALSLTREHARPGRVDNNGQAITCNTCHRSTDTKVQQAISNNNKSCSACHLDIDHDSVHTGGLEANCQTSGCHSAALSGDHTSRLDSAGNNYTCDTCHANSGKAVKRTIAVNSLNCGGCHSKVDAHNLLLADKVPSDIPLYTGFVWSTPMEASLFTGDAAAPSGYESGQLVVSNRRLDIIPDQVWEFYNGQLNINGWTVSSGGPGIGVLTAEFVKGSRSLVIKSYNTENSDGTGSQPGCRIEIWYK